MPQCLPHEAMIFQYLENDRLEGIISFPLLLQQRFTYLCSYALNCFLLLKQVENLASKGSVQTKRVEYRVARNVQTLTGEINWWCYGSYISHPLRPANKGSAVEFQHFIYPFFAMCSWKCHPKLRSFLDVLRNIMAYVATPRKDVRTSYLEPSDEQRPGSSPKKCQGTRHRSPINK